MATKKKIIKPKVEIKEPLKSLPLIVNQEIDFKEVEILESEKYELNYVSIRRKIIAVGKKIKLISEQKKEKISLWNKYENWFNSRINPKLSSISELLSAKWRKIKFKEDNLGENKSEP